jgi:hypothetical protein
MFMKRVWLCLAMAGAALSLSGCITPRMYVDKTLGDVPAAERAVVAEKRPVQLLFQFQRDGKPNPQATNYLSKKVTELVSTSGLFSQVSSTPVQGGALLSVTLNNLTEADAASKGFATGLTLGLAGTSVVDSYVGTVSYAGGTGASPVSKERKHQLYTLVGTGDAPASGLPVKNAEEGVNMIVKQMLDHLLNDLAKDPAFAAPRTAAIDTRQLALLSRD